MDYLLLIWVKLHHPIGITVSTHTQEKFTTACTLKVHTDKKGLLKCTCSPNLLAWSPLHKYAHYLAMYASFHGHKGVRYTITHLWLFCPKQRAQRISHSYYSGTPLVEVGEKHCEASTHGRCLFWMLILEQKTTTNQPTPTKPHCPPHPVFSNL